MDVTFWWCLKISPLSSFKNGRLDLLSKGSVGVCRPETSSGGYTSGHSKATAFMCGQDTHLFPKGTDSNASGAQELNTSALRPPADVYWSTAGHHTYHFNLPSTMYTTCISPRAQSIDHYDSSRCSVFHWRLQNIFHPSWACWLLCLLHVEVVCISLLILRVDDEGNSRGAEGPGLNRMMWNGLGTYVMSLQLHRLKGFACAHQTASKRLCQSLYICMGLRAFARRGRCRLEIQWVVRGWYGFVLRWVEPRECSAIRRSICLLGQAQAAHEWVFEPELVRSTTASSV